MGRGIIIALALSLAANVFLGGFVAGRIAGGPHDGHGPSHMFSFRHHDGREEFPDLTPAARESLKRAFIEHRAASREDLRDARKLHEDFVKVLSADDYDRAAADALASKFEAAERSGRAGMARILVEAADGLSVEDRKSLAKHIDRRGGRWKGRRGREGGPPPEGPPPEEGLPTK